MSPHEFGDLVPLISKPASLYKSPSRSLSDGSDLSCRSSRGTFSSEIEKNRLEFCDHQLKARIRNLRVLSRVLSTLLTIATLVPLLMTITKFMQTRDVYFNLNGEERTAWATQTVTGYTYFYTGITSVSLLIHACVLAAYLTKDGIRLANKGARVSAIWSCAFMFTEMVILAISVGIYRYGREPVDGKYKDLWGWTCSTVAQDFQMVLTSVDFKQYCAIQTTSFYTGIFSAAASALTAFIFLLALMRKRSKKLVKRATLQWEDDLSRSQKNLSSNGGIH